MTDATATALRRGAFSLAAIVTTMVAHSAATGHVAVDPFAVIVALGVCGGLAMSAMAWTTAPYRAWGFGRTLTVLGLAQLVAHGLLIAVPLITADATTHRHAPLIAPIALVCHLLVAGVLSVLLRHGQLMLARLVRVLTTLLVTRRPRRLPRPARLPVPRDPMVPAAWFGARPVSRGPPGHAPLLCH